MGSEEEMIAPAVGEAAVSDGERIEGGAGYEADDLLSRGSTVSRRRSCGGGDGDVSGCSITR